MLHYLQNIIYSNYSNILEPRSQVNSPACIEYETCMPWTHARFASAFNLPAVIDN